MLLILPGLAFLLLVFIFLGLQRQNQWLDWREAAVYACLLIGAWISASTEILGLFHAIHRLGLIATWMLAILLILFVGWRLGLHRSALRRLSPPWQKPSLSSGLFSLTLSLILGLLLLTAWKSPPNNIDSLQYHMSRVVHWAQNRSLSHYATAYNPQLWSPPFAEIAILHLRILWGNDQPANLVQWLAYLGLLCVTLLIARQLGAGVNGQRAAAAFTAALPIGILEASSTQNDIVVAFWLVCLVYLILEGLQRPLPVGEIALFGVALGLAFLTKGYAYSYALPFVLWYFLHLLLQRKVRQLVLQGLIIAAIVAILNAGYWARNYATFGGPLGTSEWVGRMAASRYSPASLIAGLARNIAQNFATPSESFNQRIIQSVQELHQALSQDPEGFSLQWAWNHEDLAGSPHYFALAALSLVLLIVYRKRSAPEQFLLWYILASLAAYLLLALVVKFNIGGLRYQYPFWVLWAPVFGIACSLAGERRFAPAWAIGLLVLALPWVLVNRYRPIIAMRPVSEPLTLPCWLGCTAVGSILVEPPESILFARWTEMSYPFTATANVLRLKGCKQIGLAIDSHQLEYPFWYLLDAPQSGVRIETVLALPETQFLQDPTFKPCAIVCTLCENKDTYQGLRLFTGFQLVNLYLAEGYR